MARVDAYRPLIRNPVELIRSVMTPQIVGRGFEVGAMRSGAHCATHPSRETAREAVRILRDGRLILAETRRGSAEEGCHTEGAEGRPQPERAGPRQAGRANEAKSTEGTARLETPSQAAVSAEEAPELSPFEKIFLAHFEGGIPVASETLGKGEFRFLAKTEKGWAEFFQKFAAFALLKSAKAGDVQSIVFRGLIKPDGTLTKEAKALLAQSPMVLVSDLKFMDGKTDKFARLAVASAAGGDPLLQILSKMAPGEVVSPEVFAELLQAMGGGEEFSYLALSHKIVNPDMARADPSAATQAYQSPEQMRETAMREGHREATPGIALSAKTERMVAERLDIDLKARTEIGLDRRTGVIAGLPGEQTGLFGKKKKRSGLWEESTKSGDEGGDSSVFVPWYQHVFRPQKFKGKPRWWVPFTYALVGSAALLAAYYAFRFWMQ